MKVLVDTEQLDARRTTLERDKAEMVTYLEQKRRIEDWHGVQDAGSDIREIDARLSELDRLRKYLTGE